MTEVAMLGAAFHPNIELLFTLGENITAAGTTGMWCKKMIPGFLARELNIGITEGVMMLVVANQEWGMDGTSRNQKIPITEAAAAGNWVTDNEMVLMLEAKNPTVRINETVVIAAARNWTWGKELVGMLADHASITMLWQRRREIYIQVKR